jgi:transposase
LHHILVRTFLPLFKINTPPCHDLPNLVIFADLKLLKMTYTYTDIATRAMIVSLKASNKTTAEVVALTGVCKNTVNKIFSRAVARGFEPSVRPIVLTDALLADKPRSGRPSKQAIAQQHVIDLVRRDRYGREKTCADIAGDLSHFGIEISAATVLRILHKAGFRKTKPTRKPGLTQKMRKERLDWCLERQHWTLEDWKKVIWTDESSVVLLHRRGGYRIWRTVDEKVNKSCIRERWKGSSEFMFWGSFSYDKKGPCHCWSPETAQEKRASEKELEALNILLEPGAKKLWELEVGVARIKLRTGQTPGREPEWRWNKKTGKLVRGGKGGIDWWRYQKIILTPKLLPFAKACEADRPGILVQEDKAPAHSHSL